jgi:hypothetical protein
VLANERKTFLSYGINLWPSVMINNISFRGSLEGQNIFEAVCAALDNPPSSCNEVLGIESNSSKESLKRALPTNNFEKLILMESKDDSIPVNTSLTTKFYYFHVNDLIPGEDIAIEVRPVNYEERPELVFMVDSRIEQSEGSSPEFSDNILCLQGALDICTIPGKNISANRDYYFKVGCPKGCAYSLKVSYQKEKFLKAGENFVFDFVGSTDPKIVKVFVPQSEETDHFLVYASHVDGYYGEHPYTMEIFKGNEVIRDGQNVKGILSINNWFGGKGVALKRGDENFCTGCNYTVLIAPSNNTILRLYSEVFGASRKLVI